MKEIIARILNTANELDEQGLYQEADTLTKLAQSMDEERGISDVANDIGDMFGLPRNPNKDAQYENKLNLQHSKYEAQREKELEKLLRDISSINLKFKSPDGEIMLGAGFATYLVETANRLLEQ